MDRSWLKSVIPKIVLICILPVRIEITDRFIGINSLAYYFGSDAMVIYSNQITLALIFLMVTLSPAIVFNYIEHHRSQDVSVKRIFATAIIFGSYFIQAMVLYFMIEPIVFQNYELYLLIWIPAYSAIKATQWGLVILVFIPFLMRERRKIDQAENRSLKQHRLIGCVSRYRSIVLVMTVCIFFAPAAAGIALPQYEWGSVVVVLVSGLFLSEIERTRHFSYDTRIDLIGLSNPFSIIIVIFFIYFTYKILQYLQGKATRRECILIGLVATIVAPFLNLLLFASYVGFYYPIPVTFFVGLIIIRYVQPVMVVDSIWDEHEDVPWFDPEAISKEQKVKIPFLYLLKSKLGRSHDDAHAYDWGGNDDVFATEGDEES